MVSAKGICYNDTKTADLCTISAQKRPMAIQIFGSEPQYMEEATHKILEFQPDIIDINMGCPVPKIVKQGAGSALMRTPDLAADIVKSVKSATNIPVTVKIRSGWDENSVNAVKFAQLMEKSGADAITIHGRTRQEMYSGQADFDIIKQVKENVNVPVIGNGDVKNLETYRKMRDYTGCDYVMVGRGSYGNPWVFKEISTEIIQNPTIAQRLDTLIYHIRLILEYHPERIAMREARKHVSWYLKGLKNAAFYRNKCTSLETFADLILLTEEIKSNYPET
jgi:nifR3 family TIM-barrel protein